MDKPLITHLVMGNAPGVQLDEELYECVTMTDLKQALRAMQRQLPNLVIMSLDMPSHFRDLSAIRSAFPTVPVVVISGCTTEEALIEALRLGVRDFLKPPVEPAEFVSTVKLVLNGRLPGDVNQGNGTGQWSRSGGGACSQEIARAMNFMQANFWRSDMSLERVAEVANMSLFHFSRTFKRLMGLNYSTYLAQLRIDQAKVLLRNRTLSVTEICLTVGYNDLTHFERVFKRIVGKSPTEYRRSRAWAAARHDEESILPDAAGLEEGVSS